MPSLRPSSKIISGENARPFVENFGWVMRTDQNGEALLLAGKRFMADRPISILLFVATILASGPTHAWVGEQYSLHLDQRLRNAADVLRTDFPRGGVRGPAIRIPPMVSMIYMEPLHRVVRLSALEKRGNNERGHRPRNQGEKLARGKIFAWF